MRLSGLRKYIFLFMTMGTPWESREFHLDFDPAFAVATEAKYLAVISHLERGADTRMTTTEEIRSQLRARAHGPRRAAVAPARPGRTSAGRLSSSPSTPPC